VKKAVLLFVIVATSGLLFAQDSTARTSPTKEEKKAEKKQRINSIIKQEEEGNLAYVKQNGFGIQLRTNGYGLFFELGKRRSPRFTNTYSIELTEIKHPKEEKIGGGNFFSNPYVYGKINNFYQAKLGFGQQYIFGQKGNKNGVAVIGIAQAGLALGLLKPYYINTRGSGGTETEIKYSSQDSIQFLTFDPNNSGAGFTKGWNEVKVKPGVFIKTALRFDFGRYNESIQAIEVGMSLEGYSEKISILAPVSTDKNASGPRQLFFQGHVAFVFGRRK
jgi:hypothetical protein